MPKRLARRNRRIRVEERGASLADGVLQAALGQVVVDRRIGHTEEEGQRLPTVEQVAQSAAEAGVGLNALFGKSSIQARSLAITGPSPSSCPFS
jgi:hypothetical protein